MNRKLAVTLVIMTVIGARAWLGHGRGAAPQAQPLEHFPSQFSGWTEVRETVLPQEQAESLKADDYLLRDYSNPNQQLVNFFVAYYRFQEAGETMHSPKNCLPGGGWSPVRNDTVSMTVGGNSSVAINRYVIQKDLDRELVLYWYEDQGRIIASEYWGKFYLVWDTMRTGRRDGAIVRVAMPITPNQNLDSATSLGLKFAEISLPQLRMLLPL